LKDDKKALAQTIEQLEEQVNALSCPKLTLQVRNLKEELQKAEAETETLKNLKTVTAIENAQDEKQMHSEEVYSFFHFAHEGGFGDEHMPRLIKRYHGDIGRCHRHH
jgi:regulator of replication initiation timing